jgi:hypothetical protein
MSMFSKVIGGVGAFLVLTGVVYWVQAYEWEGAVLMVLVAGGAFFVGAYLVTVVRRARVDLAGHPEAATEPGAAEPHVGPTIWPLVFALAAAGLVIGAVGARWAYVAGGVLVVAAGVGWILDVRRQWRHHAGSPPHEVAADAADRRGHA